MRTQTGIFGSGPATNWAISFYGFPLSLRQKFRQVPNVIGDPGLHCWRDAQRAVNPAEVVIGKVQAVRGPQVLPLL